MNIFISTSQSENSFLFNKENEPVKTLPQVYQLRKDITNIKQNMLDDTKGYSISCVNLFTKEILFSGAKLGEVFFNGQAFGSYAELSAALTPILFKLGGSPGAGGAENIPRVVTITLADLEMTSSNTEEEIIQALAVCINGLNITIGEKELYFFQIVTDTIKKTYLIKDQGKGLIANLTPDKLFNIANGNDNSNASVSPLIEVTYDELVNLKNTSSLVKGQNYLLTDYMTTYTQPVTNVNKSSGVIEPLIITATDVNKLHNVCKSTLYPQDIVYYEITGDIGNSKGTEGFTKGKIYRRIDTQRNNDIGTDWRHIKYDRDGVDKLLFEDYAGVYNNKIETYFLFNNVIGRNFNNNTIGNGFFSNRIGNDFSNNRIRNDFSVNTIANGFTGNIIEDYFYFNTIGDDFTNNIIKDHFTGNTGLYYFTRNKVKEYFTQNTIGNSFGYNTIGDGFDSNIIGDYFASNITRTGFQLNGNSETPFVSQNTEFISFIDNITSSTEIENKDIDVVVFKSPNGTLKQRYYDDSNNLVITNL